MTESIKNLSPELVKYSKPTGDPEFVEIKYNIQEIIREMKSEKKNLAQIKERLYLCEKGFLIDTIMMFYEEIKDLDSALDNEISKCVDCESQLATSLEVANNYRLELERIKSDTLDLRFERILSNAEDFLHKHKVSQH